MLCRVMGIGSGTYFLVKTKILLFSKFPSADLQISHSVEYYDFLTGGGRPNNLNILSNY